MRERNPVTHDEKLAYLRELRDAAIHSASEEAVEKQHAKGKMTARERVEKLLDPGSFEELDTFVRHRTYDFEMQKKRPWGDAVVTGNCVTPHSTWLGPCFGCALLERFLDLSSHQHESTAVSCVW